jgi:hypothetical protein
LGASLVVDDAPFLSDDASDDCDDWPDDDPLPESPGAADATGVFATASPMPSATARAQM